MPLGDSKYLLDAMNYIGAPPLGPQGLAQHDQSISQQLLQNQYAAAANQLSAAQNFDPGYSYITPGQTNIHQQARSMLFSRLNGLSTGFVMRQTDFILTHVHKDKVYIFFITEDKAGHLEDDKNLYPSDKLITQIRLLWSA